MSSATLGFRQVENEVELCPRAQYKAGGAHPVNRAKITTFRASAFFVGDLFRRLAGHARRGEPVEIEPRSNTAVIAASRDLCAAARNSIEL